MVKDNTDRVKNAEALLKVQAAEIAAKVANTTFNALAQTVYENEAEIVIQAGNIASKVSQTNYNGETIASLINQAANEVKILANKITLEGIITANSNFKVLADGSIEAKNAKLSGSITATKMVAPSGAAYFGEIGVSGGKAGMGLYDTNYNSKAYFKVEELQEESGFNGFNIYDELGQLRISIRRLTTRIFGPTGDTWIWLSPNSVTINSPNKQETW